MSRRVKRFRTTGLEGLRNPHVRNIKNIKALYCLNEQKSQKETLGIRNWTQTGKGTYTRALSQKNEGSIKIEQRTIKMGDRTIYKTRSLKGHLFKTGLADGPTCERCLEKDESATHILCDCEAAPIFYGTK
jgi:hypothetical protein